MHVIFNLVVNRNIHAINFVIWSGRPSVFCPGVLEPNLQYSFGYISFDRQLFQVFRVGVMLLMISFRIYKHLKILETEISVKISVKIS